MHLSIHDALVRWQAAADLGKADGTRRFHREVVQAILRAVPDPARAAASVTADEVTEWAQRLAHYCPSRWNAMVSALRAVTDQARQLRRRKVRFREFTPPSQMQFQALLAECDRRPRSQAGLIIRLLALTGLRIGEARRLTWSNVFEDRIVVPAGICKSRAARSIPILPETAEVLERLRALAHGDGRLLPTPHVRRALETACRRVGLPALSYHCFRHLFATRCIEAGVDVPTVARWLGHQDGGALLSKMYFHLLDDHSRTMARRVRMLV